MFSSFLCYTSVWAFPLGWDRELEGGGLVDDGEWTLALDVQLWCSAVYGCVCVSLPALVQIAVPCEGSWLVLVPSELDPSFYTLAKAKRMGSRHNRKPRVITVGLRQSGRSSHSLETLPAPSGLPVSISLSKESTDPCSFTLGWAAGPVSYSCM